MKNKGNTYQTNRLSGARVMEGGKQNKQKKNSHHVRKQCPQGQARKERKHLEKWLTIEIWLAMGL